MNLLDRIANYFKEWDGIDETAPTMELNINELRYIASMNIERCNLIKKVNTFQNNAERYIEASEIIQKKVDELKQSSDYPHNFKGQMVEDFEWVLSLLN